MIPYVMLGVGWFGFAPGPIDQYQLLYACELTSMLGGGSGVNAQVIVVEPTGAETELLVQVGEAKLVLAVHGRVDAMPDQTVGLAIDTDRVHLFDRQSGRRMP